MAGYREGLNKKEKQNRLFTWIAVILFIAFYTRIIIMLLFGFLSELGILMDAWEMLLWSFMFIGFFFSKFYVTTKTKEFHDNSVSSYQFTDTYVRKGNKGEDILYGIDPTSIVEVNINWTESQKSFDSNQIFLDIQNTYMKDTNIDRISREQILLVTSGSEAKSNKKEEKEKKKNNKDGKKKQVEVYMGQKERLDKLFTDGVIESVEDYNSQLRETQNSCGIKCQAHFLFAGEKIIPSKKAKVEVLNEIPQMLEISLTESEILILQNSSYYFARLYESETFEGVKIKHDMVALVLPPEVVLKKDEKSGKIEMALKKGTFQEYYQFPVDNAEHQGYPVKIKMCRDARDVIGFIGPNMPLYFVRWTQKMGIGLLETAMTVSMMVNVKIEMLKRYVYYMKSLTEQAEMQLEESNAILEYIQDKFDDNIQRIEELGETPFGEDPLDERISKTEVFKREKFYKTIIVVLIVAVILLSIFSILGFALNVPGPTTNGGEIVEIV